MTYFLAAMAASGIFVIAGWRSKQARAVVAARGGYGFPADPLWGEEGIDVDVSEARADVGTDIRVALERLAPALARQAVRVEIACAPGLLVRMKSATLTDFLQELLTVAIHGAPASRLLLTATTHGDRIHVSLTDDSPAADPASRLGGLRHLMERVALRGGALDVNFRPAEGTTITLRLIAATGKGRAALKPATALAGPAKI